MISKVRIKALVKESLSRDMIGDIAGDLAMQIVGGFDIADWAILVPAMIKNLREIRKGTTRVEEEMVKFAKEPSKHIESLRDAADDMHRSETLSQNSSNLLGKNYQRKEKREKMERSKTSPIFVGIPNFTECPDNVSTYRKSEENPWIC